MEETIGGKIKQARQEKGYTLDDLQQITKIQKRHIIAIEENDFDSLPGDFYVRAFIKQIAEHVGLDGNQLIEEYAHMLPQSVGAQDSTVGTRNRRGAKRKKESAFNSFMAKIQSYFPTAVLVVFVMAILFAIYQAAMSMNSSKTSSSGEASSEEVSSQESSSSSSVAESSSSSSSTASSSIFEMVADNGAVITYTVTDLTLPANVEVENLESSDLWASIAEDEVPLIDGVLASEETLEAKISSSASSITITFGYTPDTTIKIGNHKLELPKNTTAKTIYITIE